MEKLQRKLKKQRQLTEKYKKRYQRATQNQTDTPRTKTKKLLKHFRNPLPSKVRKTLNFHYALVEDLSDSCKRAKTHKEKQTCLKLLTGKIIRRYRYQRHAQEVLGLPRRCLNHKVVPGKAHKKATPIIEDMKKSIVDFYVRDDNSRIMPGKKDTITKHKKKMQKRLISDHIKNVHLKYLAENPQRKVSYSLFCALRPFWVVIPL